MANFAFILSDAECELADGKDTKTLKEFLEKHIVITREPSLFFSQASDWYQKSWSATCQFLGSRETFK